MLRIPSTLVLVVLLLVACGGEEPQESAPEPADTEFVDDARVLTNRLRVALKSELSAALQEGGPVAAIEVCNLRAPEIAGEVSDTGGLEVGRVSRRNRNPANAPGPTAAAVLAAFEARPALDDTVVTIEGRRTYLRAIRIDTPACLKCHGPEDELDPALRERLDTLYPADAATGFAEGDLRGAFVVR